MTFPQRHTQALENLTLRTKPPLNFKYSNKGKFPLRFYRMEKSTCWFSLDKEVRTHELQRDYWRMTCLIIWSRPLTPDVIGTRTMKTSVSRNIPKLLIELICCTANSYPDRSELSFPPDNSAEFRLIRVGNATLASSLHPHVGQNSDTSQLLSRRGGEALPQLSTCSPR